jgi:thioredoxin-like negative regulator of GroEL
MQEPTVAQRFEALLENLAGDIGARAYEIIENLRVVGELQVAAEHLAEILCEDQIAMSPLAHREFLLLLTCLGVKPHFAAIVPPPRQLR